MELEGIIFSFLPVATGSNTRGTWSKQEVIIDLQSEFNKKVCVSFWGDKVNDIAACKIGDKVKIGINIESREYNGRWYTDVRGWKVDKAQPLAESNPMHDNPPLGQISDDAPYKEYEDDLPF